MATYTTRTGDVLDEVVYKYYGQDVGMTEKVLEANSGLADQGVVLPSGIEIQMPEITTAEPAPITRLWD